MDDIIYLDNGATAFPKPQSVYDFMHRFYQRSGVSPGRAGYDKALETEDMVQSTRKMMTELFNGDDPERLVFSYNASDALNIIVSGLLKTGDHVVTTCLEHNSVLRPLYHKENDGDIKVTYVPFNPEGFLDPGDVKKAFQVNTRMVIMNHASNVIGTVQPVKEIGQYCREAGITFVVDASQSAGAIDIDIQDMNIDVIVFTGHKSLMGPTGIGGLYCNDQTEICITRFGGTGVRSAERLHPEEFPFRLECGTLNILGVSGLYAGLKWIREKGIDEIHRTEMELWDRLRKGLQGIDQVTIYCADRPEQHIPVLSMNLDGWEAVDVGTMLDGEYNIAVRTGLQCAPLVHEQLGTDKMHGTVRFSIGPFNTRDHIEKAILAVKEIADFKR